MNTGDIGFLDPDGYLYLRGRSRDLIISKGQNIYPAEIENVLSENDDLLEFTVVGVPDAGVRRGRVRGRCRQAGSVRSRPTT